jgi:hypothetical protein
MNGFLFLRLTAPSVATAIVMGAAAILYLRIVGKIAGPLALLGAGITGRESNGPYGATAVALCIGDFTGITIMATYNLLHLDSG